MTPHRLASHPIALLSASHLTLDFYQAAIAALVPFMVLHHGYTYAQGTAIVLASSLFSSIVQPLFGLLGDKRNMSWIIPPSILCAGSGIAGLGYTSSLPLAALLAALSGIGVAAFHPASAQLARSLSRSNHSLMSWFSLGGNIGFVLAPLYVAGVLGTWGFEASWALAIPAFLGICASYLPCTMSAERSIKATGDVGKTVPDNDWKSFIRMSLAITLRSIVFVGIGSFIVLFMHEYRSLNQTLASASLFIFYLGGAVGTLAGGYLTRKWSRISIIRMSYLLAVPAVAGTFLLPGILGWIFIALTSVVLFIPFSLHVTLGQDYLPSRTGTASGVTLGLAVSVGGLVSPLLGAVADHFGLLHALLFLVPLPAFASLILLGMKDPQYSR